MTRPDRIAVAALVSEGRLLIVHRHPSRRWYPNCWYPNCWDLVGGHIEARESPARAVHRECLEELGVRIDTPVPVPMRISDPWIEMHAFRVTSWAGKPANWAPEEHDDLRWFTSAQIPTLVTHTRPACRTSSEPCMIIETSPENGAAAAMTVLDVDADLRGYSDSLPAPMVSASSATSSS